jgi:2-polyprenyl-6-methoxyphenol hydroxylase-like FAD-dependent oxidoreductase
VPEVDVLVVGAGPTGLTLAAQLHAHGASVRVIDRNADRVHESRALAVQPRTLEVLTGLGLAETLVARGNRAVRLALHAGHRVAWLALFGEAREPNRYRSGGGAREPDRPHRDRGLDDTDYPYLLFVSQAVTEQVLGEHLTGRGIAVEREVTLVDHQDSGDEVTCTLRRRDGGTERVRARYLAGCDGAHSTVRERAGIPFAGDAYPQRFALADLEVDGVEPGAVHAYLGATGPLFFFPLGEPATWRMIAMRPAAGWPGRGTGTGTGTGQAEVTLDALQAIVDAATGQRLRLRDPVWLTEFRLHRRRATRYRAGRIFLAGDAAHVHSPAGAQGMNTGIQDAWNLGWKLALVARGLADPALLDSYHLERAPVGRAVLRFTDRAFRVATTTNPLVRLVRRRLVPLLAPLAGRATRLRAAAFRTVAELAITYRDTPAVHEGRPAPRGGPRAGDRLPSARLMVGGRGRSLHAALAGPGFHLLLCGPTGGWPADQIGELARSYPGLVSVHHLTGGDPASQAGIEGWRDADGEALRRLGLRDPARRRAPYLTAQYLVRPDGHVGYRAAGIDLTGLRDYLSRWLAVPAA